MNAVEPAAGGLFFVGITVQSLTLLLVVATLLERFTEVVSAVYHYLDGRFDWRRHWSGRARRLGARLERQLKQSRYLGHEQVAGLLNRFRNYLLESGSEYPGTMPVVSGDLLRTAVLKVVFKTTTIMLGIGIALAFDLNAVAFFTSTGGDAPAVSEGLGEVATGVVAGLGTGVVHKIIGAIERRRDRVKERGNA